MANDDTVFFGTPEQEQNSGSSNQASAEEVRRASYQALPFKWSLGAASMQGAVTARAGSLILFHTNGPGMFHSSGQPSYVDTYICIYIYIHISSLFHLTMVRTTSDLRTEAIRTLRRMHHAAGQLFQLGGLPSRLFGRAQPLEAFLVGLWASSPRLPGSTRSSSCSQAKSSDGSLRQLEQSLGRSLGTGRPEEAAWPQHRRTSGTHTHTHLAILHEEKLI